MEGLGSSPFTKSDSNFSILSSIPVIVGELSDLEEIDQGAYAPSTDKSGGESFTADVKTATRGDNVSPWKKDYSDHELVKTQSIDDQERDIPMTAIAGPEQKISQPNQSSNGDCEVPLTIPKDEEVEKCAESTKSRAVKGSAEPANTQLVGITDTHGIAEPKELVDPKPSLEVTNCGNIGQRTSGQSVTITVAKVCFYGYLGLI